MATDNSIFVSTVPGSKEFGGIAMKSFAKIFSLIALLMFFICPTTYAEIDYQKKLDDVLTKNPGVIVLCYHDVGDYASASTTPYTIDRSKMEQHLQYFQNNGFTLLSYDDYIAINRGEKPMPAKAVMLTFDDGYESFYTEVYPLLKKYNAPAMMAIIGSWMEDQAGSNIKMTTWAQFREMEESGLVTIASHTYDLHKQILINEYGENGPAVGSRWYKGNGNYETEEAYKERVLYDFEKAQNQFEKYLGHRAKALVWPFGNNDDIAIELAQKVGFESTFILSDGYNKAGESNVLRTNRIIVHGNIGKNLFPEFLYSFTSKNPYLFRFTEINMNDIYDVNDNLQTDSNIDTLVYRLFMSNTWRVVLQASAEAGNDGMSDSVYFYNRYAPVKKDIFSHISGRIQAEEMQAYANLPLLQNHWLINEDGKNLIVDKSGNILKKISPFDKNAREKLIAVFGDLATYSQINGIYFDHTLALSDEEDFSEYAKMAYKEKFGKELTIDVYNDIEQYKQWTEWKTQSLIDLTNDITDAVKTHFPEARSMRAIMPEVVLDEKNERLYAQNYKKFLANYDYVVIRADLHDFQKHPNMEEWLANLAQKAMISDAAPESVIFALNAYDEKNNRWVTSSEMKKFTDILSGYGVKYFTYYPQTMMDENKWYFPNTFSRF